MGDGQPIALAHCQNERQAVFWKPILLDPAVHGRLVFLGASDARQPMREERLPAKAAHHGRRLVSVVHVEISKIVIDASPRTMP